MYLLCTLASVILSLSHPYHHAVLCWPVAVYIYYYTVYFLQCVYTVTRVAVGSCSHTHTPVVELFTKYTLCVHVVYM